MTYLAYKFIRLGIFAAAAIAACVPPGAAAAEKSNATQLIELAKKPGPGLHDAITATFDAKDLKEGTAWAGRGPDFFFALDSTAKPQLLIDAAPGPQMQQLAGSSLCYAAARIEQLGKLHSFHYLIDGKQFGGTLDVPAFRPLSYLQPTVPSSTL